MKYYFYSPVPCVLSCGGKVLGKITKNVSVIEAEKDDIFTANVNGCAPCILSDDFCENALKYDFYFGKLFIPTPKKLPLAYKLLSEKRTVVAGNEVIGRLFTDGQTKAEVSFYRTTVTVPVPVEVKDFKMINCGNALLIEFVGQIKHIALISLKSFEVILSSTCMDYHVKDGLSVDKLIFCSVPYKYSAHYDVTEKANLSGTSFTPLQPRKAAGGLLSAYDFLCCVKYDGQYDAFLSPELIGKAAVIKDFLGAFEHIIPPTESDHPFTFALTAGDRIKYTVVSWDGDKIRDINTEYFVKPTAMKAFNY